MCQSRSWDESCSDKASLLYFFVVSSYFALRFLLELLVFLIDFLSERLDIKGLNCAYLSSYIRKIFLCLICCDSLFNVSLFKTLFSVFNSSKTGGVDRDIATVGGGWELGTALTAATRHRVIITITILELEMLTM